MRPYQNGTKAAGSKTPATGGKRQHSRRGGKLSKEIDGVKKSLVKAKVTAVKAKQRLLNADKEEVNNLLEQSISHAPTTAPSTPAAKKEVKNDSKMQDKLKKSFANLKNLDQEIKKRTTRSSNVNGEKKKPNTNGSSTDECDGRKNSFNGNGSHIEVAEEAMEVAAPASGPGFLKRSISKLWNLPKEGLNGVPYTDIADAPGSPKAASRNGHQNNGVTNGAAPASPTESNKSSKGSSCVIS